MTMITDGSGAGYKVKVGSDNRLKVDAVIEDSFVFAAENGLAFNINTESVSYSGTAPYEAGCLYIKNNEASTLEIVGFFIGEANNRSGGNTSSPLLFEMYGNPTGTITGTDVDVVNRQIGSPRTFSVTALKNPTGYSVAGSPLLYQYQYGGRSFGTVNFSIPQGQSILLRVSSPCDTFSAYTGFTGYIGSDE